MQYNKTFMSKPGRKITTSSPRDVRRRQESGLGNSEIVEQLQKQIEELKGCFVSGTNTISPEQIDEEIRASVKNAVKETKAYYEKLLADSKTKEETLRAKISNLEERLSRLSAEEKHASQKFLEAKTIELEKKYNRQISELKDGLKLAQEKIEEKNTEISSLKSERDDTIKNLLEEHSKKLEDLTKTISLEKLGVDDPNRPRMDDVFVDPLEKDSGAGYESHIELEDVSLKKKEDMGSKVNKLKSLMGSFADKE